MSEQLMEARAAFTASGEREVYALQTNEAILELWQARQNILEEMNQEIKAAVNEVMHRYQPLLDQADSEYAFYLLMVTPSKES
jgi:hypothetical protein